MPMSRPIAKGDTFVTADGKRRVVVLHVPIVWGNPYVATITDDGREIRHRHVPYDRFHDSKWTQNETVRTTGYILEGK